MTPSFRSPKNKFRASLTYGKALKGLGSASSFTCNEISENEMLKHHIDQAKRNNTSLSVVWFENKSSFPSFDWVEVQKASYND